MWADAWARYALTLSFIVTQPPNQSYNGGWWLPPPDCLLGVGTPRPALLDPCASAASATTNCSRCSVSYLFFNFIFSFEFPQWQKSEVNAPPTLRPRFAARMPTHKSQFSVLVLDNDRFIANKRTVRHYTRVAWLNTHIYMDVIVRATTTIIITRIKWSWWHKNARNTNTSQRVSGIFISYREIIKTPAKRVLRWIVTADSEKKYIHITLQFTRPFERRQIPNTSGISQSRVAAKSSMARTASLRQAEEASGEGDKNENENKYWFRYGHQDMRAYNIDIDLVHKWMDMR